MHRSSQVHDSTVINPANEELIPTISLGSVVDPDWAVAAAQRAFESYSEPSLEERLGLLRRIIEVYQSKMGEMAETISIEMGSPISLSRKAQAPAGLAHLAEIVKVLRNSGSRAQGFDAHAKRDSSPMELAQEPDRV